LHKEIKRRFALHKETLNPIKRIRSAAL